MERLGKWCLRLLATGLVFQWLRLFEQGLMSLALGGFVASEQECFLVMSSLMMGSAIGLAHVLGFRRGVTGHGWGRGWLLAKG